MVGDEQLSDITDRSLGAILPLHVVPVLQHRHELDELFEFIGRHVGEEGTDAASQLVLELFEGSAHANLQMLI